MRLALLSLFASLAFAQTASYPGSVVTDNQLRVAKNMAQSSLTSTITNTATTITLTSPGVPVNSLITIDGEIIAICGVVGNVVTVGKQSCPNTDGRGFDGTSATGHSAGAVVSLFIDAWYVNAPNAEIKAIETALGPNLQNVLNNATQNANVVYSGPASGAPAMPTFRALVSLDIPNNAANTTGTSSAFTGALVGDVTGTQGATSVIKILGQTPAASAVIDATNAGNISAGTLNAARLPLPTSGTVGGVQSRTCGGGQFVNLVGTDGSVTCATPSGGGNVTGPGAVSNGFLPQWGNSNNLLTTGLAVSAIPAANTVVQANSSAVLATGWMPGFTGDATSSNGAVSLTLATVNGAPGGCGDATHVCAVTTNGKGLVTSQTATSITGISTFSSQTANFVFAGPTSGGSVAPAFRALVSADIPNNAANTSGTAAGVTGYTFLGIATQILVGSGAFTNGHCIAVGASGNVVDNGTPCGSSSGTGTVTSAGLAMPAEFTVTNSPVTTTGTLTATWATESANRIMAGPTSGGAATPAFRALVVADIPTGYLYTSLSGAPSLPISIANGGTGQTTAGAGFNALSPMTTLGDSIYGGASGAVTRLAGNTTATKKFKAQTGDGTNSAAPVWATIVAGDLPTSVPTSVTNDTNVTGSITSNVLTLGWTGTLAAARLNANVVQAITNDTNITGSISTQNLSFGWTGQLAIARGGTGQATASAAFSALWPGTTLGDTVYGGSAGVGTRLAGNTTTTKKLFTQTGDGTNSAAPGWNVLASADIPNNAANTSGQSGTTVAFASVPSTCSVGNFARGIDINGNAVNCTAAGAGSVTSVALSLPAVFTVSGSPITSSGTFTVTANGTSGGVPYFNATTTMASSAVLPSGNFVLGGGAGGAPTASFSTIDSAHTATVNIRRTCDIPVGDTSGSAISNTQLGPQAHVCKIPAAATVVEINVDADAGSPSVIVGRRRCTTFTGGTCSAETAVNLLSGALAVSSGFEKCSNTGGTTGIDGGTTCSATLQNTGLNAGDWIELVSGTAGGTAKFFVAHVIYTIN